MKHGGLLDIFMIVRFFRWLVRLAGALMRHNIRLLNQNERMR